MHYNTKCRPMTDEPRLRLQFQDGEPATRRLGGTVINTRFAIPTHPADHRVDASSVIAIRIPALNAFGHVPVHVVEPPRVRLLLRHGV